MKTIACKRWGTDADHCVLHEDHLGPCKPRQADVPPPPPEKLISSQSARLGWVMRKRMTATT